MTTSQRDKKTLKRVAVVGGGFGRYGILPAFLLNDGIEVIAVCTSNIKTAEHFANQYHIAKAFSSWQAMLQEEIDVLAIAAPPAIQGEITCAALEKKIPVFLEKQIALDSSQSGQLLTIANRNQVASCVNFIFPYLSTWQKVYSYIAAGILGEIRHVFLNWRMESYDNYHRNKNIWKTNDEQGGGVLQHFLSHSFHYLEVFFGKIIELRCILSSAADLHTSGSTFASLDLIFSNNLIVHVAATSSAYAGIGHSLEIYGSKGSLVLKNETQDVVAGFKLYYAARDKQMELIDEECRYLAEQTNDSRVIPTSQLVNAFLKSLAGEPVTHPTINDGHRVQQLLNFAKIANENHCLIKVT
jgi:predicted dehydrogenase